jgi:hypothetical protein
MHVLALTPTLSPSRGGAGVVAICWQENVAQVGRSADWKSAIQQVGNLRYVMEGTRRFHARALGTISGGPTRRS